MQDPYSAMMSSQRSDPFKSFQLGRQTVPESTLSSTTSTTVPNYYQSLQYGSSMYGSPDNFQSMTGGMGQDYSPLPAHMGSQNIMNTNGNQIPRMNPTSHTISHTATSPEPTGPPGMMDMSSPLPSGGRISLSPDGNSQMSNSSPGETSVKQESTSNSDNSSVKSGNEDETGVPPKKRQVSVPEEKRDPSYWDKRKKNNESAKRSREARRMKEEQIALRVVYLEQENLQLRTEVSLLKSEIEKLRCMLYNS